MDLELGQEEWQKMCADYPALFARNGAETTSEMNPWDTGRREREVDHGDAAAWVRHVRNLAGNRFVARHLGLSENQLLRLCAKGQTLPPELTGGYRRLMNSYLEMAKEAAGQA